LHDLAIAESVSDFPEQPYQVTLRFLVIGEYVPTPFSISYDAVELGVNLMSGFIDEPLACMDPGLGTWVPSIFDPNMDKGFTSFVNNNDAFAARPADTHLLSGDNFADLGARPASVHAGNERCWGPVVPGLQCSCS
jgi:hypothetical protein